MSVGENRIRVVDTTVKSTRHVAAGGREYAAVEIAYAGMEYGLGQVVMVKTEDKDVRWPYAHMIQTATADGFTVLAPRHSDLYGQPAGAAVVVWGPRGRSPLGEGDRESFLVVTEPAAYPACLPFVLHRGEQCEGVLFVGDDEGQPLLGETARFLRADSALAAAGAAGRSTAGLAIVALNPQNLLAFSKALDGGAAERTLVYVPTVITCGVGACGSCAIHSPSAQTDEDAPKGVLMCCQGPYQPLKKVDIEMDVNCFEDFK